MTLPESSPGPSPGDRHANQAGTGTGRQGSRRTRLFCCRALFIIHLIWKTDCEATAQLSASNKAQTQIIHEQAKEKAAERGGKIIRQRRQQESSWRGPENTCWTPPLWPRVTAGHCWSPRVGGRAVNTKLRATNGFLSNLPEHLDQRPDYWELITIGVKLGKGDDMSGRLRPLKFLMLYF